MFGRRGQRMLWRRYLILLQVEVMKGIAKVMYTEDGSKDNNAIARAQQKLDDLKL
jgi:chemotaxis protein CheY-P-specific phosphatase CheC